MDSPTDQARAWARIERTLHASGVDLAGGALLPGGRAAADAGGARAARGRARPCCSPSWCKALVAAGVETVSADYESRRTRTRRTLAVLAPTNKAASVLRGRGVPATTIHRILYTPLYHPDYEAIAEWLTGKGERPKVEALSEAALDRAMAFYRQHPSIPGALASAGLRGSDFIKGWKRRDEPLDIGLIDEASMLDERQYRRPARALPRRWCCSATRRSSRRSAAAAAWCSTALPEEARLTLSRVHRQAADNPILDLAHALGRPGARFDGLRGAWCERRRRATTGWWSARGSTPARWRGRRCWSGATRRGCG